MAERYLGCGLAVDENDNLHFYVRDALREWGIPNTPENRAAVEAAAIELMLGKWPNLKPVRLD